MRPSSLPVRRSVARVVVAAALIVPATLAAQRPSPLEVRSPNGETTVTIEVGDTIRYSVAHRGAPLLAPSAIALAIGGGRALGVGGRVVDIRTRVVDTIVRPVVSLKNARVRDHYAELRVTLDGGYALEVRAHDAIAGVQGVRATFMTHQEPTYARVSIDSIVGARVGLVPFLVDVAGGPKVAITESGLEDYAGMYVTSAGGGTATYRYYIDFAARHHVPYVILDEGWYMLGDLLEPVAAVDVPALVQYGKAKGVGVILWAIWKTLDDQMTPALNQFQRWGVRGIKVDFMQRDDQAVVNFYWRTAAEAAKRHLLVDFHGAHKLAGLNRAYPNVLSFEGVHGLENDKWAKDVTPKHDVTLPFTRMLAGPMDFTPGAMTNAQPNQFQPIFERPMSQGTRAHQLAMYVVYESPLQMLADSPSEYEREPDAMAFLASVPTTWDATRALDARVASHVLLARRRGATWYVGAMTDSARTLTLDLGFLPAGTFTLESWEDGPNAARNGMDFVRRTRTVRRGERVTLHLAPGGGYAARIR